MLLGYLSAPSPTPPADWEACLQSLVAAGCSRIIEDSTGPGRSLLDSGIAGLASGDTLVVLQMRHLADTAADLTRAYRLVAARGANIRCLELGGAIQGRDGKAAPGRPPTARRKSAEVWALRDAGATPPEIAAQLNIGERSVYRLLEKRISRKAPHGTA